jgi:hypothetical protein
MNKKIFFLLEETKHYREELKSLWSPFQSHPPTLLLSPEIVTIPSLSVSQEVFSPLYCFIPKV